MNVNQSMFILLLHVISLCHVTTHSDVESSLLLSVQNKNFLVVRLPLKRNLFYSCVQNAKLTCEIIKTNDVKILAIFPNFTSKTVECVSPFIGL